jgi:hypothetical protein
VILIMTITTTTTTIAIGVTDAGSARIEAHTRDRMAGSGLNRPEPFITSLTCGASILARDWAFLQNATRGRT